MENRWKIRLATLQKHSKIWSITISIALERYILLHSVGKIYSLIVYFPANNWQQTLQYKLILKKEIYYIFQYHHEFIALSNEQFIKLITWINDIINQKQENHHYMEWYTKLYDCIYVYRLMHIQPIHFFTSYVSLFSKLFIERSVHSKYLSSIFEI